MGFHQEKNRGLPRLPYTISLITTIKMDLDRVLPLLPSTRYSQILQLEKFKNKHVRD